MEKGITTSKEMITGQSVSSPENRHKALFKLPEAIRGIVTTYQKNRPNHNDASDIFEAKQKKQEDAIKNLATIAASAVEQQGSVSQPALFIRVVDSFFDSYRCEIGLPDRGSEMGRRIFVTADPVLTEELRVGDVVVVTGDGTKIIDLDEGFPRSGETATVLAFTPGQDFPYELEIEDGYSSKRIEAFLWERVSRTPKVGDRVRVMWGAIFDFASGQSNRFKVQPRDDLDRSDLHGPVPTFALDMILSLVDRHLNPAVYPARRSFANNHTLMLYGPPGVGKTFTVLVALSMLQRKYNNGKGERIVFITTEGSAIEGPLVGSGPATLRQIRSTAQQAQEEGKLPIVFINEAGSLLRSREVQNMQLDGGSSLSTHEQFLAMLSGPNEVPGIVLIDMNLEKLLDEATRQRFMCISFPHITPEILIDQMFQAVFQKEKALFPGTWDEYRNALAKSLTTQIGTILVGSATIPVRVENLCSGRMFENVMKECIRLLDLHIFSSHNQGITPLMDTITDSLLFYVMTKRAWSLFKCWDDKQARERLVHEPAICRAEKRDSISKPSPHEWQKIEMPPELDCRYVFDEMSKELCDNLKE